MEEQILAAKPIRSPTMASFRTITEYWIMVLYSSTGLGRAKESIMVIKAENPIFTRFGVAVFPKKGATEIKVIIRTNIISRYSI